uniref:Uncharacterized protein n=1 Tax=Arundo donax TaxID=35708 RepID=A0A0A9C2J2_ARUDO
MVPSKLLSPKRNHAPSPVFSNFCFSQRNESIQIMTIP